MQFESWSAFWDMGGYGFFVWLAFAVTFISMLGLVIQSFMEKNSLQNDVEQNHARKARVKAAMEGQA